MTRRRLPTHRPGHPAFQKFLHRNDRCVIGRFGDTIPDAATTQAVEQPKSPIMPPLRQVHFV
jgi:hypothetical protein